MSCERIGSDDGASKTDNEASEEVRESRISWSLDGGIVTVSSGSV